MLQHLSISNFALIDSIELSFGPGLNVITGETGAGKSIIVDAFLTLLGEQSSPDMVRSADGKAVIEGSFSIAKHKTISGYLRKHELESEDLPNELLLRREISARGSSRSFVNDIPATKNIVRGLGLLLVDFHGQHDHQSLLRPELHLGVLDGIANLAPALADYRAAFNNLKTLAQRLRELISQEKDLREKEAFRRFQLSEIDAIAPEEDEVTKLEAELALRENAEFLHGASRRLAGLLYDKEGSARDTLLQADQVLSELKDIDPSFGEYQTECQSAIVIVEEIARIAQSYNANIEFQPERLEEIRQRLMELQTLRKKYGTMNEVLHYWKQLKRELELTDNFEAEIESFKADFERKREQVGVLADGLSRQRAKAARGFESAIVEKLKKLGIAHSQFQVRMERHAIEARNGDNDDAALDSAAMLQGRLYRAGNSGIDAVEFHISTNPGMDLRPLAKTASGGEISRVMLALKSLLAQSDRLPMLVFDEIDTGISGRIAQKVGVAMKQLACSHQLIAITHLPQIAALADVHVAVEKRTTRKRSAVEARVLNLEERLREIARLLSGETITEASIESARELMRVG